LTILQFRSCSTNYGFFARDDWKVSPRLSVNLGMRYEIPKPPKEKYGRITNFVPELGRLIRASDRTIQGMGIAFTDDTKVGTAKEFGLPETLVYRRWGNLAPRIGFAYRLTADNRGVVRGGYRIFYGAQV
jgi:outer membrane receptor protein involved in Fe transport